jgi:cell division protein FtsB
MVKDIKKLTLRIFLALEIILFSLFYIFGSQGLQALMRLRHQNIILHNELESIQQDVKNLELELVDWRKNQFYKEKIAREQLQMARPEEDIYFLPIKK